MTLAISMLNNIFPLHTKMQNYQFEYPNCHVVNDFHFKKLLMLTNKIVLAINRHDTLRPLGM